MNSLKSTILTREVYAPGCLTFIKFYTAGYTLWYVLVSHGCHLILVNGLIDDRGWYNIYRRDRPGPNLGGGVCILYWYWKVYMYSRQWLIVLV